MSTLLDTMHACQEACISWEAGLSPPGLLSSSSPNPQVDHGLNLFLFVSSSTFPGIKRAWGLSLQDSSQITIWRKDTIGRYGSASHHRSSSSSTIYEYIQPTQLGRYEYYPRSNKLWLRRACIFGISRRQIFGMIAIMIIMIIRGVAAVVAVVVAACKGGSSPQSRSNGVRERGSISFRFTEQQQQQQQKESC